MKTRLAIVAVVSAIATLSLCAAPGESSDAAPEKSPLEQKLEAINAGISPHTAEVVKLVRSGLDTEVVKAFVENAADTYPLKSDEIIYLKENGVASPIISVMIKRAASQRDQAAAAAAVQPAVAPVPAPVPFPAPSTMAAPAAQPAVTYVVQQPAPQQTIIYQQPEPTYVYRSPQVVYIPSSAPGYCYTPGRYYSSRYCYSPGYNRHQFGTSGRYFSVGFSSRGRLCN